VKITDKEIAEMIETPIRTFQDRKAKNIKQYKLIRLGAYADKLNLSIHDLLKTSEAKNKNRKL
jgi:hypothetical protein